MVFDKEFKEAILNLPTIEKDRLLLRLLKKDKALIDKLHFELVSDLSVDELRSQLEDRMSEDFLINQSKFSPGWNMMQLRFMSGDIAYHVKTTKDKFGDASLNLLMLNRFLNNNEKHIKRLPYSEKSRKLLIYIVNKAFKILISVQGLHDDYFLDFEEDLRSLGGKFTELNPLMKSCINHGFDVNWLLRGEIPENIKEIHKDIRAQGFLR